MKSVPFLQMDSSIQIHSLISFYLISNWAVVRVSCLALFSSIQTRSDVNTPLEL